MPAAAADRKGHVPLVRGRAERLPFPDESFDHLTFTYLYRYVDDPAYVMRELARVVRPGGGVAALDFGVPANRILRALWRAYTTIGLPLIGRAISARWASVGAFLRGSIERFDREHEASEIERFWSRAGLSEMRVDRMSFGAGVVMTAVKAGDTEERVSVAPSGIRSSVASAPTAAFYALRPGGLRDYWTLLHPPYTVWHLSYVLLGAALATHPDPRFVIGAVVAFFLAVGVASHSFDELQGRPLGTLIPSSVLIALGSLGLIGAVALGIAAPSQVGLWFLVLVAIGAVLVISYGLESPIVHSNVGFSLAWGGFPVIASAAANGAPVVPTVAAAIGASLLSLAQRRLSTPGRRIRGRAAEVSGVVRYANGTVERIDPARLIAAPEAGLRLLWLAMFALSIRALVAPLS